MLQITLTPNRELGPYGFTRTTRYELKIWPDFEWSDSNVLIGASLVPVVTIKEWRDGKFKSVRVSQHVKPQGLWHREWAALPPANMGEPMRLECLRAAALAGRITCKGCGKMRVPGVSLTTIENTDLCNCPIDGQGKRAYTKRSEQLQPEPTNDANGYAHGATTDRGTYGRNDSRNRPSDWTPDEQTGIDSRSMEKAARQRRRDSGKAKARDEI